MKKYFWIVILLIIILGSCSELGNFPVEVGVPLIDLDKYDMPDYSDIEIEDLQTNLNRNYKLNDMNNILNFKIELVNGWVNGYIKYKKDKEDKWQSVRETLNKKTGDCEDYGVILLVLTKLYLEIEGELWSIRNKKNGDNHIIVVFKINNEYCYFNMLNEFYNSDNSLNINYKYSYEEAIKISEYIKIRSNYIVYK